MEETKKLTVLDELEIAAEDATEEIAPVVLPEVTEVTKEEMKAAEKPKADKRRVFGIISLILGVASVLSPVVITGAHLVTFLLNLVVLRRLLDRLVSFIAREIFGGGPYFSWGFTGSYFEPEVFSYPDGHGFRYVIDWLFGSAPIADVVGFAVAGCFVVIAGMTLIMAHFSRRKEDFRLPATGKAGTIFAILGLLGTSVAVLIPVVKSVLHFLLGFVYSIVMNA